MTSESERVCITQHEQKEYDSCSWENDDFGKELFLQTVSHFEFLKAAPFWISEGAILSF